VERAIASGDAANEEPPQRFDATVVIAAATLAITLREVCVEVYRDLAKSKAAFTRRPARLRVCVSWSRSTMGKASRRSRPIPSKMRIAIEEATLTRPSPKRSAFQTKP